jgi:AcrR family transcriptional regulator
MRKAKNRERVLEASIDLFNQSGVVAITTNHIADHLKISPGNLYFHFRNKEAIIVELFEQMTNDVYGVWKPALKSKPGEELLPAAMIEQTFEVFFKFRFFHREMYHLRRKDPVLAAKWKTHINKSVRLLTAYYGHWVKSGIMKKVTDPKEMQMISDVVLITSSSFLQFFESPTKPATRRSIRDGVGHILRFLLPYHTDSAQSELRVRLRGSVSSDRN